ncbi:glycosyltransferase family 2 protein [Candidatus Saccharibacteria bacterium]|nr:glycosyltransferase family 2 protein [Candidatus Saccharibacteria bacterium]
MNDMDQAKRPNIGIVIVAHDCPAQLRRLLRSIGGQLREYDELVVVDNHKAHISAAVAKKNKYTSKVLEIDNLGFANGCNRGVELLSKAIDLIFFVNPDTTLGMDCLDNITSDVPAEWSAWMGLLIKNDGLVNSAGNVVHISGLSWCGGFDDKPSNYKTNERISFLTGAGFVVRAKAYKKIGGMPEDYFLYYEDTAFSSNLLLHGLKIGIIPYAHIYHEYDYQKSKTKWFYIERNRYIYMLSYWPASTILFLLPYLFFAEIGLWIISIFERRFILKLQSLGSFLVALPKTLKRRRYIQKSRVISSYDFFIRLEPKINTLQLGSPGKFIFINQISSAYYALVKYILKLTTKAVK